MTKKARIAAVQHECNECRGEIKPGHIYLDESQNRPDRTPRFVKKRTCAACVNGPKED